MKARNDSQIVTSNLAVCVLFFEKLDQTIECIQSFLHPGINIYILNNGSSISTSEKLKNIYNSYKQIKFFDSRINLGVAGGRNYLIDHTSEEWLLFVDSDIVVNTPDWLQKLRHYIVSYPEVEAFVPKIYKYPENKYATRWSIKIEENRIILDKNIEERLTNCFPGGASLINRNLFTRLGRYDDKMFTGFEDFEICIRAIYSKNPVKAQKIQDVELVHKHLPVDNRRDKNAVLARYDFNKLQLSYNRIVEKYNLFFDDSWKEYANTQINQILRKNSFSIKKLLRRFLPNQQ